MTTIKYKKHFWNYDNVTAINFNKYGTETNMTCELDVWTTGGTHTEVNFDSEEDYEYAKNKLEEGLISNFILIDLEKYESQKGINNMKAVW